MRIASGWKRWVGGLAAAGLLGACSTVPVYGIPAYPDYDADGADRAVFVRSLEDPGR